MTTKTQLPYICAQVLNMLIQAVYDDDETPVTHAGALCEWFERTLHVAAEVGVRKGRSDAA